MSYHERFDKEFPELVSMSDGITYRNVCDRQKVLAFLDEVALDEYAKGVKQGRFSERAALAEKVEYLRKPPGLIDQTFYYNKAIHHVLTYLREPEANYEKFARHTEETARKIADIQPPDASQGCCKKCLDFTFQEGNMVCVDEDCPCHSPQGDKAEGSV